MKDKKCSKHNITLEKDGICEKCFLEKSIKNAKQFRSFVKKLIAKRKKKK